MAQKPVIPKGTRDFGPSEMHKRDYIFSVLRNIFQFYGFDPLETPAMENLSTLSGKYGSEGDRLLFKILDSGNYLKGVDSFSDRDYLSLLPQISSKGLRYDLTVPFARYVSQHQHSIRFPFKRYQIQPVWRADRPQRGRYREFYQCDVDVIGMDALFNEAELLKIIDEVFIRLGLSITIKINHRKILQGITEVAHAGEHFRAITVAIDKLDKVGLEGVLKEMKESGVPEKSIDIIKPMLLTEGSLTEKMSRITDALAGSEKGMQGVKELEELNQKVSLLEVEAPVWFDLTLARGLDYYTGTIIEVVANEYKMGSICGGGRYDDLTGVFGLKGVSGVGVSFGAERIYDLMEENQLFPENLDVTVKVMLINFGGEEETAAIKALVEMRKNGVRAELYPKPVKLKKQMSYANTRKIPHVAILGKDEMERNQITIKNMQEGTQETLALEEAIKKLHKQA